MSEQKVRVAITQGDINGIGCEIIIKTFADSRMCELCTPIIYGSAKALSFCKSRMSGVEGFQYNLINSASEAKQKKVNLIDITSEDVKITLGTPTKAGGDIAVSALLRSAKDYKQGLIDAIVTAPISKENVQSDKFNFTGHTEFFANEFDGEPLMLMCSELLKVGLVTMHVPVSKISSMVTVDNILKKLKQLRTSLISDFSIVEPRIAVLALNPHAGDGGLLGEEENTAIKPAIIKAQENGILAFGPFPADGFFAAKSYKKFDAVLAMYHDQGLVPFKALTPEGVNVTGSLRVIRTSPDHGTAYDIAGQFVADETSMREAVYMAIDIFKSRRRYMEMTRNPLRRYEREKGADVSIKDLVDSDI